jgi:hypothetical protein
MVLLLLLLPWPLDWGVVPKAAAGVPGGERGLGWLVLGPVIRSVSVTGWWMTGGTRPGETCDHVTRTMVCQGMEYLCHPSCPTVSYRRTPPHTLLVLNTHICVVATTVSYRIETHMDTYGPPTHPYISNECGGPARQGLRQVSPCAMFDESSDPRKLGSKGSAAARPCHVGFGLFMCDYPAHPPHPRPHTYGLNRLQPLCQNTWTHTRPNHTPTHRTTVVTQQAKVCSRSHHVPCLMRAAIHASCAAKGVLLLGPAM